MRDVLGWRRKPGAMGFSVVRDIALQCPSWTGIAEVPPSRCRDAIEALDGGDADAIVQVGTSQSMVRLAAAAGLFLGRPVIAIDAATHWLRCGPMASPTGWRASAGCWKNSDPARAWRVGVDEEGPSP